MLIFDLTFATRRTEMTGVERYGINLFEAVRELQPDTVAFAHKLDAFANTQGVYSLPGAYGAWFNLPGEISRRKLKAEAVIFPTSPASPRFLVNKQRLCRIIHDAFPWSRERAMPWKGRLLYRYCEDLMAKRYDVLLGTTEPVAEELSLLFKRPQIEWVGNAPGLDLKGLEQEPEGVPDRFILFVGTVEPRKNYLRLIELVEIGKKYNLPIVLAGRPGWGEISAQMQTLAIRHPDRFFWLRDLNDESLRWLYRHASIFASLSKAEGFNMPLAEAAICGRPLVCSDIAIHRSVAAPWAQFIASDAPASQIWQVMKKANSTLPTEQEVNDYQQRYSWEGVAKRLVHLLERNDVM